MKVEDVLKVLEQNVAPVALSDDFCKRYGAYDNSGIIVNGGKELTGALFSLDFSEKAVEKAISLGYNLVVTHHPAIYGGVTRLDTVNNPQSRTIALCLQYGISVISMHLNFDAAPHGIDYYLMKGLGGENDCGMLSPLQGGGYGRVYDIEKTTFGALVKKAKKTFRTDRLVSYGEEGAEINKVASFCGAGSSPQAIAFAKEHGANLYVSSDMKHHELAELVDNGINVIVLTHYSAEAYGFSRIYNDIESILGLPSSFFFDERLA